MREEIEKKLINIFNEYSKNQFGMYERQESNLVESLELDSLGIVQLVVDIEDCFDIDLDETNIITLFSNYTLLLEYIVEVCK